MDIPITEKELDEILKSIRYSDNSSLYNKLWCYKINYLQKHKKGIS